MDDCNHETNEKSTRSAGNGQINRHHDKISKNQQVNNHSVKKRNKRRNGNVSKETSSFRTVEKEEFMVSLKKRTRIKMKHRIVYRYYIIIFILVVMILTTLFLLFFSADKVTSVHGDTLNIYNSNIANSERNHHNDNNNSYSNTTIKHYQQMQNVQPLKYVTVILPSVVNPKGRTKRLDAITTTWGPTARAIYVTHPGTDSDYSLPPSSVHTSTTFPRIMPIDATVATPEEGIPRLQHVISQIVQEYNPDFAFFANDHTFIIPQHLCSFLTRHKLRPDQHVYAGHALRPKNQKGLKYAFNSGASGYFLSRKTMQFLMEHLKDDLTTTTRNTKWLQGNPGLVIAQCLKKNLGIDPIDTRDDLKRHVFHAFGLIRVVKKDMDEWYEKKHEDLYEILGEDEMYRHELQKGTLCCSPDTVSFHYVEWAETLALWEILLHVTQTKKKEDGNGIMSKEELQQLLLEKWPT